MDHLSFIQIPNIRFTIEENSNYIVSLRCIIYLSIGEQEYSSRTAAITTAIVMCIIVPIIIGLAYVGYKLLQRRKKDSDEEEEDEKETLKR